MQKVWKGKVVNKKSDKKEDSRMGSCKNEKDTLSELFMFQTKEIGFLNFEFACRKLGSEVVVFISNIPENLSRLA